MSIAVMVLGQSGTGKSTSMRNMDPAEVLLIQALKKPLPFRSPNWKPIADGGNIMVTDDSARIVAAMHKTVRKAIVIDDFQYIMSNEFMRRSDERGYDKFTDIGRHAWDIIKAAGELPDDVRVYILAHTETDEMGRSKAKTIGKMLDDKICLEGMLSIVLGTHVSDNKFSFTTQNNGSNTVKSPMGLFETDLIDNDLQAVDAAIKSYYGVQ